MKSFLRSAIVPVLVLAWGCATQPVRMPPPRAPASAPMPGARIAVPDMAPAPTPASVRVPETAGGELAPEDAGPSMAPAYRLRATDPVGIYLRGVPDQQEFTFVIDENGYINLPYIGQVMAAGKTTSELAAELQRLYVDGKIYKYVIVNVVTGTQAYYVRGEVRQPGRYPIISGVSLLQAIASAGGYTEFANPAGVRVLRAGKTIRVNMREIERHPERDIEVESGDVILVPRSFF